jgi:hypothetical protein
MQQHITGSVKTAGLYIIDFVGQKTTGSAGNPVPLGPIFSCDGTPPLPAPSLLPFLSLRDHPIWLALKIYISSFRINDNGLIELSHLVAA